MAKSRPRKSKESGPGLAIMYVACGLVAALALNAVHADESHARYFEQLRRRGLYSLAEGYAINQLAETNTPLARRTELTIELSRTLAEHAEFASQEQQAELWKRARAVVDEERQRDASNPRDALLAVQSALVPAAEGAWLAMECELQPFNEPLTSRARETCTTAIELLTAIERQLVEPSKETSATRRLAEGGPSSHELKVQSQRVRFQLATSRKYRATLFAAASRERSADLIEAEQLFRKLVGVADEPLSSLAKLRLAGCSRLKGDLERAVDMLKAIEKSEPQLSGDLLDELVAERARLMLERQRGADAAELIVQTRAKHKRLSGELWYLQVRALAAMRDASLQKKNDTLAEQLREQAEITLERCEEQVGGSWSRRCRLAWESVRTAEKLGPALDTAMQQARADFLAGRIEVALTGYAAAERSALESKQTDVAIDLGYTHASILLNERRFEAAAADFQRLAREYPTHSRAAAAHLNGAYSLGRLYEEKKTQSRREAYTEMLDQHVAQFAESPTVNDAHFLKGQLAERRLQASAALPLYLLVEAGHARAEEAHAGAARCYESILLRMRELKLATGEFEREAIETLTRFVDTFAETDAKWSITRAEVALHLSSLLLLSEPPRFERAESLLASILANTNRAAEIEEQVERWQRLRQRAATLSVIALAGNGRTREAEQMMQSLAAASPRDLLAIVERLAPFVASENRTQRLQYVELQLRAANRLNEQRAALSKPEQESLDQSLGRAFLASGQITKGAELYGRLASESPKDAARQRLIARQVEPFEERPCQKLARQCWRRVELATKPGSPDWLLARLGVIASSIKLDERQQARKLFETTKALYPAIGGDDLQQEFEAIEKQLERN